MHLLFHIGNLTIPAYGCMIAMGVIAANLIGLFMVRKLNLDVNDFIVIEAYCFLGGFLGAKGLYLIVSFRDITWSRIFELSYFNQLMQGGFVFYGGLIGGLAFALLAGKIHHISSITYIRNFICLVPVAHGFGRIGCFLAGCCYGIPYDGIGAVVFPENSYAIPGIRLFPVQLVESALLFLIAALLIYLEMRHHYPYTLELYLLLYSVTRFCLEFVRYDAIRGKFGVFSTSQWISIAVFIIAVIALIRKTGTTVCIRDN